LPASSGLLVLSSSLAMLPIVRLVTQETQQRSDIHIPLVTANL
jgi:hypothetical protein